MSKTFSHELHLVLYSQRVDKNFVCLGSECHKPSTWTNLNRKHLIWIINLCNWSALITVPEEDWCSLSATHQLELVIFSLGHAVQRSILCLVTIQPLFLFQIVSRDSTIHRARMDEMWLVDVWEKTHDVFLLIC
jgi:hypothetical protein